MGLMWSVNPDNRPRFSELQSAIELLMADEQSHSEYSYTMGSQANTTASDDYLQPVRRNSISISESKIYVDVESAPESEPEIY